MRRIDAPRNARSRRTRSAALDAAWSLLLERESREVTMGAVAERAGVTRRALYLHFPSRAELLVALHAHVDERLDLTSSIRRVRQAVDGVSALSAFVAHLAEFHPRILPIDLALAQAARTDPDVAALVERGSRMWLHACRTIAQQLADEGRLASPWTVETAADLMWVQMFPESLHRLTVERDWSADRYRRLLTVLLHRTLVTDQPAGERPTAGVIG